jgi:hypothetical protein
MTTEHNIITDPEIHEPKGVAAATVGQVYLSDGVSSGTWTTITPSYGWMDLSDATGIAVDTIGTTPKKLANVFEGSTGASYGMTASHVTGDIDLTINGEYLINFDITFAIAAAGDAGDYRFQIVIDDASSGANYSKACSVTTTAADTLYNASFSWMDSLSANTLSIYVVSDEAGDTDDILVYEAGFNAVLIGRS